MLKGFSKMALPLVPEPNWMVERQRFAPSLTIVMGDSLLSDSC